MDASMLIDRATAGMPAPIWFVQFFKVLGFALHMVPMNLWYAGLLLAVLLHARGGEHAKRFAARLMTQMPVIVAFGVNLGIVPLLFTQLAYYKVFYPATILMAWFWLAIIALLIPAYYGVYVYASGLRQGAGGLTPLKRAAGWCAAIFFIAIGFLFANGFSLMAHVGAWPQLWLRHSSGGAALGTALNLADTSLWPRWLLMFGLALMTTAVWMLVDRAWFARRESESYQRWAGNFALKLHTLGMVWFAVAGSWYVFGTWPVQLRQTMSGGWLHALTAVTALAPGLPWLLIWIYRNRPAGRTVVSLIGLAQFGVLGINAISRQVVQNASLREFFDVTAQPVDVQWSPLVLFLVLFVAGLGVIGWMIAQVVRAPAESSGRFNVNKTRRPRRPNAR